MQHNETEWTIDVPGRMATHRTGLILVATQCPAVEGSNLTQWKVWPRHNSVPILVEGLLVTREDRKVFNEVLIKRISEGGAILVSALFQDQPHG